MKIRRPSLLRVAPLVVGGLACSPGDVGGPGGDRGGDRGASADAGIGGSDLSDAASAHEASVSPGDGGGPTTGSAAQGGGGSGSTSSSATGGRAGRGAGVGRDAGPKSGGGGDRGTAGAPSRGGSPGSGGDTGAGGSTADGTVCPLPTKFKWSSSGPLAKVPRSIGGHNVIALKDFTDVLWNGKHIVYSTAYEGGWKSSMFVFTDWTDWDATPGTWFSKGAVAPTLIYFTPKKIWVLTYQWGFQYATSDDPTDASKWSGGKSLLSGDPTGGSGPIDQTVICDDANCYLFFAGDNGHVYRASMPIGNFPGTFSNATSILEDTQSNLFEAVEVYSIKGAKQYLMIVEAMGGGGRYFRGFTSTSLDGKFTPISGASTESSPFAGKNNVTFSGSAWTNDISHGDMVRNDPSETQTVDPCNMQFLYQGYDKTKSSSDYGTIPYQPGLLTLQR